MERLVLLGEGEPRFRLSSLMVRQKTPALPRPRPSLHEMAGKIHIAHPGFRNIREDIVRPFRQSQGRIPRCGARCTGSSVSGHSPAPVRGSKTGSCGLQHRPAGAGGAPTVKSWIFPDPCGGDILARETYTRLRTRSRCRSWRNSRW